MEINRSMLTNFVLQNRMIRSATVADLEDLVNLEERCFSVPWSKKSFEAELNGNQFSRILVVPGSMKASDIPLLAYICVWVIFEEIRFLNLAVHPQFRRQGLAKRLILEALRIGIDQGCCRGMLEVRHSNQMAKRLYESLFFKEYAIRNSYYTNPTEDAILMMLEPISQAILDRNDLPGIQVERE
jgi:[ribosomal protein S18]-alanine N-acetyltransferase